MPLLPKPAPILDHNVFIGCETGLLKGLSASPAGFVSKNFNPLSALDRREDEVTCLEWDEGRDEVLVGTKGQRVKTFNTQEKCFTSNFDASSPFDESHGSLVGVSRLGEGATLVTAARSGAVKVWRAKEEERTTFNTIDAEVTRSGKLKHGVSAFSGDSDSLLKHLASLKAGRELCKMRACPSDERFVATGGKENDLQIWDLTTTANPITPHFAAKNVKPDKLQLRVPVWLTDLAFLGGRADLVASANRHGHVRLYDLRDGAGLRRRPVAEAEWEGEALTAMAGVSEQQVLIGTGHGRLGLFDFRSLHKGTSGLVRTYKGCVGSVRSIATPSSSGKHFVAVGLDRFARVFAIDQKQPLHKLYVKSRLNCVCVSKDFDPTKAVKPSEGKTQGEDDKEERMDMGEEEDEEVQILDEEEEIKEEVPDDDGEADPLWKNMAVVGASGKKRKKTSNAPNKKKEEEEEEQVTKEAAGKKRRKKRKAN